MTQGGIYPAIVGTLLLIIGSMSIALPMGIMAAIYLKEYAENNLITWPIEMAISNLARRLGLQLHSGKGEYPYCALLVPYFLIPYT